MSSVQKLMIFRGEIRVIPGLTRYQSIILINYLSSGKVRMYYFFIFVIIWYRYQCFIFVFFTVPIIYFDTVEIYHKLWYVATLVQIHPGVEFHAIRGVVALISDENTITNGVNFLDFYVYQHVSKFKYF